MPKVHVCCNPTHLSYNTNLAPSNFWLFQKLKEQYFSFDAKVEIAANNWIRSIRNFLDRIKKWIEYFG